MKAKEGFRLYDILKGRIWIPKSTRKITLWILLATLFVTYLQYPHVAMYTRKLIQRFIQTYA